MAPFRSVGGGYGQKGLAQIDWSTLWFYIEEEVLKMVTQLSPGSIYKECPTVHPETSAGMKSNSFVFTVQGTFIIAIIAI